MDSELPGIIRVKVAAKNILLGSLGTRHQAVFAMQCHFLKKHANFLNQTVTLFSLLNCTLVWFMWKKSQKHFFLWVQEDPFHAVKLRKYFIHMRVKTKTIEGKVVISPELCIDTWNKGDRDLTSATLFSRFAVCFFLWMIFYGHT